MCQLFLIDPRAVVFLTGTIRPSLHQVARASFICTLACSRFLRAPLLVNLDRLLTSWTLRLFRAPIHFSKMRFVNFRFASARHSILVEACFACQAEFRKSFKLFSKAASTRRVEILTLSSVLSTLFFSFFRGSFSRPSVGGACLRR